MLDNITITIDGKKYTISSDITLQELSNNFQKNYKYPIVLARVNHVLKALNEPITSDCTIEFLDLTSKEGNKCHISGLTFILIYAVKKLYGKDANVYVLHSLDKGLYIETSFKLTEAKVKEIKEKMKTIIEADMPISKVIIERAEAIKYYQNINDEEKAGIMSYNTNNYVSLYRLGNYYNYFYNIMPASTGALAAFDLNYIADNGFCLRFPTVYINDKIKPYKHHPGVYNCFKRYNDWAKTIDVESSYDLNKVVSTGNIDELIRMDEAHQNSELLNIASEIGKNNKTKIVLIAGPSSSGKTTCSKKLCMYLRNNGIRPKVLSMDDYFVERVKTPKKETGEYDYESLDAIDIDLFNKQIGDLLEGKKVKTPTFNFIRGKKEYLNEMELLDREVLVIEGIHAIDPAILSNIPRAKKYKIYLSPLTGINIDDHNHISTTDNRLLRRIIRDNRTRGCNVTETFKLWSSVREGEEKYIFPFQDEADYTLNTALIYEIGVLKTYVEPLLYSIPTESEYYEEAKRLLKFLRIFFPIPSEAVPQDSILREFIGNGCFHE